MFRICIAIVLVLSVPSPGLAFEFSRNLIGRVSVFTNDFIGDGRDRWRSGAYFRSTFSGPPWTGDLPAQPSITEFRLRGETIAPTNAYNPPAAGERPYVGVVAAGLYTHFGRGGTGYRVGAELVATGPQTGVSTFVTRAHEILGFRAPIATAGQLGDAVYPTVTAEAYKLMPRGRARPYDLRPFAEFQVGVETYARVGVDLIFGAPADGALATRDPVTGQVLTVATVRRQSGLMPSVGVDIAYVEGSKYLPASSGLTVEPWRMRARIGARYVADRRDLFVGLTWLGPEYTTQQTGQVVGSLAFNYRF